jgi:hypothetical protein
MQKRKEPKAQRSTNGKEPKASPVTLGVKRGSSSLPICAQLRRAYIRGYTSLQITMLCGLASR